MGTLSNKTYKRYPDAETDRKKLQKQFPDCHISIKAVDKKGHIVSIRDTGIVAGFKINIS